MQYFSYMILGSIFGLFIGKCDSIFVYHVGPLTDAFPAIVVKAFYRKKLTIWTSDIWPDTIYAYGFKKTKYRDFILGLFIKFIYKNCNNILVSSPGFIKKINSYVPKKNIEYVPAWANESINQHSSKTNIGLSPIDKFHFTFAGNIGKVQNLENVILGFSKSNLIDKAQLNIIGDGSNLQNLKNLVINEKIKNVIFWGKKTPSEMYAFYNKSHVLIVSLINDSFLELTIPGKFQTCLLMEKPIFAIMNGDVRNIVEEEMLGFSANPSDISGIGKIFDLFVTASKETLNAFGIKSKQYAHETYNKACLIKKVTDFIN